MTLQQHLGDACRAAEVAVDLKGRISIEHIGIHPLRRRRAAEHFVCVVAILESGPNTTFQGNSTACPSVAAEFQ